MSMPFEYNTRPGAIESNSSTTLKKSDLNISLESFMEAINDIAMI
jgi:hypothetical protein